MTNSEVSFPEVQYTPKRSYRLADISELIWQDANDPNDIQAREDYGTDEEIQGLCTSILETGLLEAPIVIPDDANPGKFRVLEGNRRLFCVHSLQT